MVPILVCCLALAWLGASAAFFACRLAYEISGGSDTGIMLHSSCLPFFGAFYAVHCCVDTVAVVFTAFCATVWLWGRSWRRVALAQSPLWQVLFSRQPQQRLAPACNFIFSFVCMPLTSSRVWFTTVCPPHGVCLFSVSCTGWSVIGRVITDGGSEPPLSEFRCLC